MSLINKMLQDLDARGGAGAKDGLHPLELKPVPRAERERSPVLLGAVAAGITAVAVAGWLGWRYWQHKPAAPPPAVTQVQAVPPPQAADLAAQAAQATQQVVATTAAAGVASVPGATDTPPAGAATPADSAPAAVTAPLTAPAPGAPHTASAPTVTRLAAAPSSEQDTPAHGATPERSANHRSAKARAPAERALAQAEQGAAPRNKRTAAAPAAGADAADSGRQNVSPAQLSEGSYRRGLAALQEGRSSEALAQLERALDVDPRNDAARQTYISLLLEQRRPDDAIRQLRLALGIDARQPGLAMVLARLQLERGGPALETLMRTLPYADGSAEYQAFVAGVLQREQRHDEAAERYRAALKISPQNGVWWMGLGISLQAGDHVPEARDAFQRAKAGKGLTPELQSFVERKLEQLAR